MNKTYLNLMEKTLSAYTKEHIFRYFDEVKKNGLTEHGFPRLTANIGILIAYHRRCELLPTFLEMMELCCKTIPNVKAANDFSVREIICCIAELEKTQAVDKRDIFRWKGYLASINPESCYNVFAKLSTDKPNNWALFTGVSEFFRQNMGLCDSSTFIDVQIASQLQRFDENGMYMDHGETHNPTVYDLVARGLFCLLLFAGYRGKYYQEIDNLLKKSALYTLNMQSVTGEIPFGGRSNQFLHNEAWLAAIFEYEAQRYKNEGNNELSRKFKAAAMQALKVIDGWLSKNPISHIKNRFSIDSSFGCESYAYFDKYMITTASFLYAASLFSDDSILPSKTEKSPTIWQTSEGFHKIFMRAGAYSLEFDTNADLRYDANGLGRIHKKDAPSTICLSVPFPQTPDYSLGNFATEAFSIAPSIKDENGEWIFGASKDISYRLVSKKVETDRASLEMECIFQNGKKIPFTCEVDENGVTISACVEPNQEIGLTLPLLFFDGETYTRITKKEERIVVEYEGWNCEYASKQIIDLNIDLANRNGLYKGYMAIGKENVQVKIKIN